MQCGEWPNFWVHDSKSLSIALVVKYAVYIVHVYVYQPTMLLFFVVFIVLVCLFVCFCFYM